MLAQIYSQDLGNCGLRIYRNRQDSPRLCVACNPQSAICNPQLRRFPMCGGVIFPYKKEYKEMLEKLYSPEDVARFEATGEVRSLYWQKSEPVLPVVSSDEDEEG